MSIEKSTNREEQKQAILQRLREIRNFSEVPQEKKFTISDENFYKTKYRMSPFTGVRADLDFMRLTGIITDEAVLAEVNKFIKDDWKEIGATGRITESDIQKLNNIIDYVLDHVK